MIGIGLQVILEKVWSFLAAWYSETLEIAPLMIKVVVKVMFLNKLLFYQWGLGLAKGASPPQSGEPRFEFLLGEVPNNVLSKIAFNGGHL